MVPDLVSIAGSRLTTLELVDPSLRPAPRQRHSGSLFVAWSLDWWAAALLTQAMISAWLAFIDPLVFSFLPSEATDIFMHSALPMQLGLTPLVFFTMTYLGISNGGQTLGMRLMKHAVDAHSEAHARHWAFGAMVSAVTGGVVLLIEHKGGTMLDAFAGTHTTSLNYRSWVNSQAPLETSNMLIFPRGNSTFDEAA